MKISIITASYNSSATIEDTILSIDGQTYADKEHIVVDGKSSDNTMRIVESHREKIAHVVSEPDSGVYAAMNKGITHATGDIIGFLNSDDVYENSSVLDRVAEEFKSQDIDACYGDLVYVDKDNLKKIVRYWRSCPYQPGLFKTGWMPPHPTFFVKKEIYEKYGSFDLEFLRQSDFELTMRFLEIMRIKSSYIPELLIRMRMGGLSNNNVMGILNGNLEAYKACKKHNMKVTPFFIVRKVFSRLPQYFLRPRNK